MAIQKGTWPHDIMDLRNFRVKKEINFFNMISRQQDKYEISIVSK